MFFVFHFSMNSIIQVIQSGSLSVYPSVCLLVSLSVHLSVCLLTIIESIHRLVCLSVWQSCQLGSHPVRHLVSLPICLSVHLLVCLPVHLPFCLPFCLSTCLSVCLSPVSHWVNPLACLSFCLTVLCQLKVIQSGSLMVYPSVCQSVRPSFCLSIYFSVCTCLLSVWHSFTQSNPVCGTLKYMFCLLEVRSKRNFPFILKSFEPFQTVRILFIVIRYLELHGCLLLVGMGFHSCPWWNKINNWVCRQWT